jgi:hypothetical protein
LDDDEREEMRERVVLMGNPKRSGCEFSRDEETARIIDQASTEFAQYGGLQNPKKGELRRRLVKIR